MVAYIEGLEGLLKSPSGGRVTEGAIDCDEMAAFFEGKQVRLLGVSVVGGVSK